MPHTHTQSPTDRLFDVVSHVFIHILKGDDAHYLKTRFCQNRRESDSIQPEILLQCSTFRTFLRTTHRLSYDFRSNLQSLQNNIHLFVFPHMLSCLFRDKTQTANRQTTARTKMRTWFDFSQQEPFFFFFYFFKFATGSEEVWALPSNLNHHLTFVGVEGHRGLCWAAPVCGNIGFFIDPNISLFQAPFGISNL